MNDCIFCNIVSGKIRIDTRVYEDDYVLAFLSTGPLHPGHTLIVPKVHYDQIYQLPPEISGPLGIAITKVGTMVKKAMGADGINVHVNNEKAAGQAVFHVHVHIIPRYFGDGYKNWEPTYHYKHGEMAEVAEKIRKNL